MIQGAVLKIAPEPKLISGCWQVLGERRFPETTQFLKYFEYMKFHYFSTLIPRKFSSLLI